MPTVMLARNGQGTDEPDMQTTLPHVLPTHQRHRYDVPHHHLMIMRTLSVPLYLYYHCFPYRLFRKVLLTLLGEVRQNLNKMYLHVKVALIGIQQNNRLWYMWVFYKYFFCISWWLSDRLATDRFRSMSLTTYLNTYVTICIARSYAGYFDPNRSST